MLRKIDLLGILLFCSLVFANIALAEDRKANAFEFAYSYLASELLMPEICDKISPRAYLTASFVPRGHQITYTKSACYNNLALKTGNAEYCVNVKRKRALLFGGGAMTEKECRNRVAAGKRLQSSGGDSELILRFMGYTENDVSEADAFDMLDLYFRVARGNLFKQRAKELPDFRTVPPLPKDFDLSAIGCANDDDPRWFCHQARCLMEENEEFREACMEISHQIRYQTGLTGRYKKLADKYPRLKQDYVSGVRAEQEAVKNKLE